MTRGAWLVKSEFPVLLVDDEPDALICNEVLLRGAGLNNLISCSDSREVITLTAKLNPALILLDLWMPHKTGQELLKELTHEFPATSVVVVTGMNDIETAIACIEAGAEDYLLKPVEQTQLLTTVYRILENKSLTCENERLRDSLVSNQLQHHDAFNKILSRDNVLLGCFRYLEAVAPTDKPLLILGETGTGKDLFARATHEISGRKGAFVAVNIGGLDDTVFSDTLFGHVKGAYTGADSPRAGIVEQAKGGTLFLDEIGDLNDTSQTKLLRLLQSGEYMPLGSDQIKRAKVRIIAATHRNLEDFIETKQFRRDLYYRLKTHRLKIPPLRERRGDLPMLAEHFARLSSQDLGKPLPNISIEFLSVLNAYDFPGNVRELESVIFEAVSHSTDNQIPIDVVRNHLDLSPNNGDLRASESHNVQIIEGINLADDAPFPTLKVAANFLVAEAMRRSDNNQTAAARLLGISRPALSKRLKK